MGVHLAIDLGAESGRGILGTIDRGRLRLEEVHRFPNLPVQHLTGLRWDFPRLFLEIKTAIARGAERAGGRLDSIGVDSWGVDYGLLDHSGELLANPFHYRDPRTDGVMEEVFHRIPRAELFDRTGIQFLKINTIFQLFAHCRADPEGLTGAHQILMIADLVNHFLTGRSVSECTLASTTGLLHVHGREWAGEILERLEIPSRLFPEIVPPGTLVGRLRDDIVSECRLREPPRVVAPACHDTASAVAAAPGGERGTWAFLSSGTWSLMGVELAGPQLVADAMKENFTNEAGVGGTIRFLKNLMGLWLVQECRRQWIREGHEYDYETLTRLAGEAPSLHSLILPDDPSFFEPGDMPERIRAFCARTSQPVPKTVGEVVRCSLESLALSYRSTLYKIETITGSRIERVHVVGGGSQNQLLNRFTSAATGRPVTAGPVEATASGNVLLQALALGELPDLVAIRNVVRSSFQTRDFPPRDGDRDPWDRAYERFGSLGGR